MKRKSSLVPVIIIMLSVTMTFLRVMGYVAGSPSDHKINNFVGLTASCLPYVVLFAFSVKAIIRRRAAVSETDKGSKEK